MIRLMRRLPLGEFGGGAYYPAKQVVNVSDLSDKMLQSGKTSADFLSKMGLPRIGKCFLLPPGLASSGHIKNAKNKDVSWG